MGARNGLTGAALGERLLRPRSAAPAGTSPMIVTVIDRCPRVVSPPTSETSNSLARSKNPLANFSSHSWFTVGSVRASIAQ